jgi:hypothetical protein
MNDLFKPLAVFQLLSLMTLSDAFAGTPEDERLRAATAAFTRADGGDASAAAEATVRFGELSKADPGNPLLLVQFGAATTMQARSTMLPWKKISYAEKGIAMQDKAVAMLTPKHDNEMDNGVAVSLRVRYVAANTFLAVPEFFDHKPQGERLFSEVLASPLFNTAAIEFRGHVWMRAARNAERNKRLDEARTFLNLAISGDAPQANQAKKDLERIGR